LQMKLPSPSCRVVEVLVFFVFELVVGFLKDFLLASWQGFADRADELPVHMILGLREYDAFRRDHLGSLRLAGHQRDLHCLDERHSGVANDVSARRILIRIQAQLLKDGNENRHMVFCLTQVFFPFLAKAVIDGTLQSGFVDEHAALFRFESFIQKGMQLITI
jgi:hypothetical protein